MIKIEDDGEERSENNSNKDQIDFEEKRSEAHGPEAYSKSKVQVSVDSSLSSANADSKSRVDGIIKLQGVENLHPDIKRLLR